MGILRKAVMLEQNVNTLVGVQVDTALIGSAGITVKKGQNASVYIVAGTQTSSLAPVILSLDNAASGDRITVKKYSTAVIGTGAAQVQVLSGSAAGAIVGAFQIGTAAPNEVTAVFDGVAQVWR